LARFGLLAVLPPDDVEKVRGEVERMRGKTDEWTVASCYNGVYLGNERLNGLWG
jgi:hypothetical protein